MYQNENAITSDEPNRKISKFALIWIAVIALCMLSFVAAIGLLGWGFYSLVEKTEQKNRIPYATETAVAQWPVAFRDDFEQVTGRWYTGETVKDGRRDARSISNGTYTWTMENAGDYAYWHPAGIGIYKDFAISVDVQHAAGSKYDEYGIIFCNVARNYYAFTIQDRGYYSVVVWSANNWNEIVPFSKSSAIKPGEFNHLMVLAQNGGFKLFINYEFVQEFHDSTLPNGDVGLVFSPENNLTEPKQEPSGVAHILSSSISKIIIDNFELRAPEGPVTGPGLLPQLPQIKPAKGKLVFASNRNGERDIYTVLANGTGLKQLTTGPDADYGPRWSPDGKKIVFVSRHANNSEIYVMDADGSNLIKLTENPADDTSPGWSPDGKQIIFSSDRDGNHDIYLMSAQGEKAGISQLTDTDIDKLNPLISPDGTQILFQMKESIDHGYKLYVVGIDGKRQKPFTNIYDVADYTDGVWSPDGIHFAYVMKYSSEYAEIMVGDINHAPDYSDNGQITWGKGGSLYPCWSPNGEQIAFVSDMDGQSDLYITLSDGNGIFRVTHNEAVESSPDWHE